MLEEPIANESLALKDVLKEKRDKINMSNQEIADRSGLSIHTVTNYFSARSKAASAYTVGMICKALGISFDAAYGIIPDLDDDSLTRINVLEHDVAQKAIEATYNRDTIKRLEDTVKHQRFLGIAMMAAILALLALVILYLVKFDLANPGYGIIRSEAFLP